MVSCSGAGGGNDKNIARLQSALYQTVCRLEFFGGHMILFGQGIKGFVLFYFMGLCRQSKRGHECHYGTYNDQPGKYPHRVPSSFYFAPKKRVLCITILVRLSTTNTLVTGHKHPDTDRLLPQKPHRWLRYLQLPLKYGTSADVGKIHRFGPYTVQLGNCLLRPGNGN